MLVQLFPYILMYKKIPLVLLSILTGCVAVPTKVSQNGDTINFKRINAPYLGSLKSKKDSGKFATIYKNVNNEQFTKLFLEEMRTNLEGLGQDYRQKSPNTLRAGFDDISYSGNAQKYADSNYHNVGPLLAVTYRPRTLYGTEFNKYIAYCPMFFDWEQRTKIVDYFRQFGITPSTPNKKYYVTFSQLSQYVVMSSFSQCATFNEAYNNRINQVSEKESKTLGDMFAISMFMAADEPAMARFIVDNNTQLHKTNLQNKEELQNYFNTILRYSKENDISMINTYDLWKLTYNLKRKL